MTTAGIEVAPHYLQSLVQTVVHTNCLDFVGVSLDLVVSLHGIARGYRLNATASRSSDVSRETAKRYVNRNTVHAIVNSTIGLNIYFYEPNMD